jgi:hypothetical protein
MSQETEFHVSLEVFGQDPGEVSRLIGLEPTEAWRQGDKLPRMPAVTVQQARWSLSSGVDSAQPLEVHLASLLTRLEARRDQIARVSRQLPARICVAAYFREPNPGLQIDAALMARTAALGLSVDFDLYLLGDLPPLPVRW